jgi:serine/threonine-protein kinase
MTGPQLKSNSAKSQGNHQDGNEFEADLPRIFERHLLLKRIAKGGMGEVFLATSEGAIDGAERPCVLKMIRSEHAEDSSFLARFLDEARIQAQLEHPGVVRVLHASHDTAGKPYVVLEHVEGRNLSEVRVRVQQLNIQLKWPDAVAIAIALTEALAHIHERTDAAGRPLAIVHRDLSPQNVMVGYSGDVKVIDFGTARGHNRRCHTVSGIVYAKPGYVAPEVANNQPGGIPADLYAVGVMLWELLAGRRFISGDAAEHLAAVAAGTKVVTPIAAQIDAPPELDAICRRLTATKLDDRFESASEACNDLAQLLKRAPSTADGQRSVRVRIAQMMQRLYPAEPTRTRAEFQRLIAASRRIAPPASALVPSPSPAFVEVELDAIVEQPAAPREVASEAAAPRAPESGAPTQAAPAEAAASPLLAGTRYELGDVIGEGASSTVYDAKHIDLNRKVALKLCQRAATPAALETFRAEARNVAQLAHENIVQVHDFGLTQQGQAFLAMERLEGESMEQHLNHHGALEYRSALSLTVQICRALEAAHAAGITHGDLKPANLMLTKQGTLKLLDFGVSALAREYSAQSDAGESFCLRGTPEYLAPEQLRGQAASTASDLYALGVVLYELLTGARPHDAESMGSLIGSKLTGDVQAPSALNPAGQIPKSVDRLCLRLLAREARERFASATETRIAVERILDGLAQRQLKVARPMRMTAAAVMFVVGACAVTVGVPELRGQARALAVQAAERLPTSWTATSIPALHHGVALLQSAAARAIANAKAEVGSRVAQNGEGFGTPDTVNTNAEANAPATNDAKDNDAAQHAPASNSAPANADAADADEPSNQVASDAPDSRARAVSGRQATQADRGSDAPTKSESLRVVAEVEAAVRDKRPLRALDIARHLDGAARHDPALLRAWIAAATATRAWGEAHRVAKELTELDNAAQNWWTLAQLERRMGRFEEARKSVEHLLALDPDHAGALALKARLDPSSRVAAR